jgi:hypothetical protein
LESSVARKKVIKVRLDDAEMAIVEEATAGLGIPLAAWCRYALMGGARARLSALLNEDAKRDGLEPEF